MNQAPNPFGPPAPAPAAAPNPFAAAPQLPPLSMQALVSPTPVNTAPVLSAQPPAPIVQPNPPSIPVMASAATTPPLMQLAANPPATDPDAALNEAQLTGEYIALRDAIKDVKSRHADELAPFTDRMTKIESTMLARLSAAGVKSLNTTNGTAYQEIKQQFSVEDGDAWFAWVAANNRMDMLTKSARQDAIREFVDERQAVPPGIKVHQETVVRFRK